MIIVFKALFCHKLSQNNVNYYTIKGIFEFVIDYYNVQEKINSLFLKK